MRSAFFLVLCAAPLAAQTTPALAVAPSGRATTEVSVSAPRAEGQAGPKPFIVRLDYGQPHARGRVLLGNVIPFDSVWRTGANRSTTLTTDIDLILGGVDLPKGAYSIYTLPTRTGWTLIVNRDTGQAGTSYDKSHDVARIPMRSRPLRETVESLSMVLEPDSKPPARGTLRISWGDFELSVGWRIKS